MTEPTTWRQTPMTGKTALVRAGAAEGLSYAALAARHGTTRSAIAGIASRARARGEPIAFLAPAVGGHAARKAKPKPKPKRPLPRPKLARLPIRERTAAMRPKPHQGLTAMLPVGPPLPPEALYKPPASAWTAPPGSVPVRVEDHRDGCRWPIGDPSTYCNEPARDGKPYCAAHCAIAYHPLPPKAHKPTRAR